MKASLKVLIADFDLFSSIGGGQTFYRNIVEKNPHIDFYYLLESESLETVRPRNANVVPYKKASLLKSIGECADRNLMRWKNTFLMAENIAESVRGYSFDIVDVPDYNRIGALLRSCFVRHKTDFGKIALSLHGPVSKAFAIKWSEDDAVMEIVSDFEMQERMQWAAVDVRYGISKNYLEECSAKIPLKADYLNPLNIFTLPLPALAPRSQTPPDINFIGRTEKQKGPDLFVELLWWLRRSSYGAANLIGPSCCECGGTRSDKYLEDMIKKWAVNVQLLPELSRDKLQDLFYNRSLTILPSRSDTFNLVALESLFSGCPTAVSEVAGICRLLDESYPEIPYHKINIKDVCSSAPAIEFMLDGYDEYRKRLVDVLMGLKVDKSGPDLEEIYRSSSVSNAGAVKEADEIVYGLASEHCSAKSVVTRSAARAKKSILGETRTKIVNLRSNLTPNHIRSVVFGKLVAGRDYDYLLMEQAQIERTYTKEYINFFKANVSYEKNNIGQYGKYLQSGVRLRIDRLRVWNELARIEEARGDFLLSAVYKMRIVRLLGEDRFGYLPFIMKIFRDKGFEREALVADAVYGGRPDRDERCLEILKEAFLAHKDNPGKEYELVDDRRGEAPHKISIIVSLYNAGAKLYRFLKNLHVLTKVQKNPLEIILIDSGSPTDEYAVFKQFMESHEMPVVYARTHSRETIQTAWNRGILLARSPYMTCLGADEVISPDCLEVLASELDRNPSLDWVQGDTIITEVDADGLRVKDIMSYDRTGYKQHMVYLDTCYLNWVGGLHRRSIYERFGYYDGSFKAAGDTEFKLRILPHIRTKHVPGMLGVFKNYPEERTTQHPRAEIEDLRAWYLHRTTAGVKYAFTDKDPAEAEDLLRTALHYRKTYCSHLSTDVEYAYNLALFMQEKTPASPLVNCIGGLKKVLDIYRSLEYLKTPNRLSALLASYNANSAVSKIGRQQLNMGHGLEPVYKIFNDNRYEQHSDIWSRDIW